jgi:hypothetical protein
VDNQLAYIDQGSYLGLRALGRGPHQQYIWVYDHDIDLDGLRKFHRNLGFTLLGRRIERSPLPFGRHRWVAAPHQADLAVAPNPRPRSELRKWLLEQSVIPVDPEFGPSWRMAMLPFTGGGGAVMMMISHSVADGGAIFTSVADAVMGRKPDYGYPLPQARTRRTALREDFRATVAALPEAARAVRAAVRVARKEKADIRTSAQRSTARPVRDAVGAIAVPSITALVDIGDWDQRAEALGGTSNVLMSGVAARLGMYRGRSDADGMITLNYPVSDRAEGDTRANALSAASVKVDPLQVVSTLSKVRADIKTSLAGVREDQSDIFASLALAPFMPKPLVRRLEGMALGAGYPVGCTNMGDVNPVLLRLDGTPAALFFARSPIEWPVTPEILDKMGGSLVVGSARVGDHVVLAVSGWQVGAENTEEELAERVQRALADFDLTGTWF